MLADLKIATGTTTAAVALWVEQANAWGSLLLTVFGIIVACITAWYTWERAIKLRRERKENK